MVINPPTSIWGSSASWWISSTTEGPLKPLFAASPDVFT